LFASGFVVTNKLSTDYKAQVTAKTKRKKKRKRKKKKKTDCILSATCNGVRLVAPE
jgi:hypothetical protein